MALSTSLVQRMAGHIARFLINRVPAAMERVLAAASQVGGVPYKPNAAGSADFSLASVEATSRLTAT